MEVITNNAEYILHHPNAVEDSQSAHLTALVGNEKRTKAAQFREVSRIFGDAALIGTAHVRNYYKYKQRDMFKSVTKRLLANELDDDEAYLRVDKIFSSSSLTTNKPHELQAGHIAIANLQFYSSSSTSDLTAGASRWLARSVDLDAAADEAEEQAKA